MHQSLRKKILRTFIECYLPDLVYTITKSIKFIGVFFEIMCCGNTKVFQKDFFYFSTICPNSAFTDFYVVATL